MLLELQVSPSPTGDDTNRWAHVEAAIAVIAASGLAYEVGALGTVVQGPPDEVWAVARRAHEATLAAGATRVSSVIKIVETPGDELTIDGLAGPHRHPER